MTAGHPADRDHAAVELAFLEGINRRCPDHVPTLKALADLLTRVGRIEEGLEDLRLSRLAPEDEEVWYNLGCSLALSRRPDEAFEALHRAVALGYNETEWLRKDEDLATLRDDPRFGALVEASRRAGRD